jgi:methylase of polypeptide subunit release factors
MSTIYIRCDVFPGLFETEYYVLVNGSAAYHVHRDNVRHVQSTPLPNRAAKGEVRAYLVEEKDHKALVQMTGEAAVGGLRTWVEQEAVVAA